MPGKSIFQVLLEIPHARLTVRPGHPGGTEFIEARMIRTGER
jgi:hypothetical protein